ncbi:uncharacterized protein M6B38_282055 [Iris pallida]|uniref:Late embryogenesis abundant protein LEA-2 subgroup domain-containing protein n=1 Tax=Iris pallida TaxID=29817 RepID=A0AAX6I1B3_IRIPA|nr:uncharacterized protein M6B38_282055 [Iris pallida]
MAVTEQTSQSPLLPQPQIPYGIPYQEPSTTYVFLQAYRRRRRSLRRFCPSLFSSSALLFFSLLLLVLLAAAFFLYPSDPQISLSRLRLNHLRVKTLPFPSLTISLDLKARVRNPDFFSLRYTSLVASIGYRGKRLGVVESRGGRIRARGVSYVDAELELDGIEIIGDVFYLIEDVARGVVPLETVTELDGVMRLFFVDVPVEGRVSCSVNVNPANQTIIRQDCYPE